MNTVISYTLRSDGEEFAQSFKVKGIAIINEANRIPRTKIILLDGDVSRQDFALSNLDFFKPGKQIEIELGYDGHTHPVFTGLIVRHALKIRESNASSLELECKHAVVKLSVNKKNRFFYDQTDQAAISEVLDEAGISYSISGMTDITHGQLVQYGSSSWDFMLLRAEANGHLLLFDHEVLTIAPPDMEGDPVLNCQYGANVISFDAVIDSETQFAQAESKAWSSADQEMLTATGSPGFTNGIGNLSVADIAGMWGPEPYFLQHAANLSETELETWANAKATRSELCKIMGHVRIKGDATAFPGKLIQLTGFGDRFTGRAYVTGVRHEVSNGNWTTDIQFGLPASGPFGQRSLQPLPAAGMLPAVSGMQIGVVTQLANDPDNENRVKVRLPIVSSNEDGVWARMTTGYAGNSYGICFYPEIGDEVAVGFLNDDPRQAIIIGALYSSAHPAPLVPADDNDKKGIVTRSEVKVVWDDKKKAITISTPGGNEVILDDEDGKISIRDAHRNVIQMGAGGIIIESAKDLQLKAGQHIDINGINITQKANGKFEAEGASGAEMKTNAVAVLKGSLVQIN